MSSAKAITLDVIASQASQLCFEVGGILGSREVELGQEVSAFDFPAFYATLGGTPTIPGHPARLLFDFLEIQAFVKPFTLLALRAEAGKAALHKAINVRANAYYSKYADSAALISRINTDYSPNIRDSKANRLDVLSAICKRQMEQLRDSYISEGRTGVVKTTSSVLTSTVNNCGKSVSIGKSAQLGVDPLVKAPFSAGALPAGGKLESISVGGAGQIHVNEEMSTSGQRTKSTSHAMETQSIENTAYGYQTPEWDNAAQYQRAQISLIDERFALFLNAQKLPYFAAIFQNELNSIDAEVFQLQIAYLNTILMSPISGTVTGVYKSPGDAVTAGEPVIRIENSAEILLVATLIYRGPITIGSTVKVQTTRFAVSGSLTFLEGRVVAVRGQRQDDQWEVVAKCKNVDGGGKPIFPLGYHFDYDDTKVVLS